MAEIDASLRRLGMDYIDLYQIHRWDEMTPIEETLEALHDVIKAGKVRYIGASSMNAWRFTKALYLADKHGWNRFISMQPQYNLMYREEEREMLPLCLAEGIGVMPWSPLARGRLALPWADRSSSRRFASDAVAEALYSGTESEDRLVVERLTEVGLGYAAYQCVFHYRRRHKAKAPRRRHRCSGHFTHSLRENPPRRTVSATCWQTPY